MSGMTYGTAATSGSVEPRLGGASGGMGFFNKAGFCAAPAITADGVTITSQAACPTCGTLYGNSGVLVGLGQFHWDISIVKLTKFTERHTL